MIDRQKREHLSHRLRLLVAGQITNDEFEDSLNLKSEDIAIWRIFHHAGWTLYDDTHEYKLSGKYKLTDDIKRNIARVILFLKSDREYEWKEPIWYMKAIVSILSLPTFGFISRLYYRTFWSKQGDPDIWPYIRKSDFDNDLEKQPYLKANENR